MNSTGKKYLIPFNHTTKLSPLTMKPLIAAMTTREMIKKTSVFLRMVHAARKIKIKSTIISDIVLKGLPDISGPKNKSLTKPVHVASQKPMKKRRCIKNRFSNLIIF